MESDHLQQFLAEIEERICTCGAGHGSGEGHTDWCEWVEEYYCPPAPEAQQDPETHPDNAPASQVLAYLFACANSWEPEARIIGNARAGDIVRALSDVLPILMQPEAQETTVMDHQRETNDIAAHETATVRHKQEPVAWREIDLAKTVKHDHPDIVPYERLYLVKIDRGWFFGRFTRQWYGLSFSNWGNAGRQLDAPGYNSSTWEKIIEINPDALTIPSEQSAPEAQQEPVAYPKIMYCCDHCSEHCPEWCGHDRLDIYVTNDGRWLCDECRENEGISSRECSSPPLLYPRPAEQAVTEAMVKALRDIQRETGRCRGAQSYVDATRFSFKTANKALKAAMEARDE